MNEQDLETKLKHLELENRKLAAECQRLKEELADFELLYETTMEHGVVVEDELAEKNIKLEQMHAVLKEELENAANYVVSILPPPVSTGLTTEWRFIPSSELGGDSFGYHWIDDDHFALYLLDVCGHGVGPALLSVSVINTLRSGALSNTDFKNPGEVLGKLNEMCQSEDDNPMFLTAWYGVFDLTSRTLTYASGGHPPSVLLSRGDQDDGPQASLLSTKNPAIGLMPAVSYSSQSCQVTAGSILLVFSDGVFELFKLTGEYLPFDEFVTYLKRMFMDCGYSLDSLVADLRTLQGSNDFKDDFSILRVGF
jgi:serine phosphatase RsbU (regulator of sigma subunit)